MLYQLILVVCLSLASSNSAPSADGQLFKFLQEVNENLTNLYRTQQHIEHCLEVHGSENNSALQELEAVESKIYDFIRSLRPALVKFKRSSILDEDLKKQMNRLPDLHYGVLSHEDSKKITEALNNMDKYKNSLRDYCGLKMLKGGEAEADALKDCWERKTEELGFLIKNDWKTWLELEKKTANFHGFIHASDYWLKNLDMKSEDTIMMLSKFLNELWPLFEQFHSYIRSKLRQKYGVANVPLNEPIPYHLYDSYVYNNWNQIELPYPNAPKRPITEGIRSKGLNLPKRTFHNVAEYYRSLGFPQLSQDFWTNNTNPSKDTDSCTTKVWNLFQPGNVQLTYCDEIDEKHFYEMFEALLEIQFYQAAQNLPAVFQIEPFPQFVESVGKAFSLNAASTKYLEKLTVLNEGEVDDQTTINSLYEMGFRTLLPLPMLYILERIRTTALDSKFGTNYNCFYWELVEENVGVKPPSNRTNVGFDYAEKLLVDVHNEYASSFISIILKFQVFQHFCEATNQYSRYDPKKPLHLCDLSNQAAIGPKVLKGLSLGASKSYRAVLQEITGDTEVSTAGIIEYFKPLYQWFLERNELDNVAIGWQRTGVCTPSDR